MKQGDVSPLAEALGQPTHRIAGRWPKAPDRHGEMFLGVVDGSPVGCVCIEEREEFPDLLRLYSLDVAPSVQSRGIGTRLIERVEQESRDRGHAGVYLEVGTANPRARALYKRLGYVREGEPFLNHWTRYDADGNFEEEMASEVVRMVKRF